MVILSLWLFQQRVILPGTLACSHHAGRWKLKNAVEIEGFAQPDPIAGNHAWHQKVSIELAGENDTIGDVYVNYENNLKIYQAWRDKLTRALTSADTLRRPRHYKRPAWGLTDNAYSFKVTD